ncbi:MAG: hypothetical protein JWN97_2431 [Nocardioides sp.]|nr:hypothetical protein [Nocardioides sp.]
MFAAGPDDTEPQPIPYARGGATTFQCSRSRRRSRRTCPIQFQHLVLIPVTHPLLPCPHLAGVAETAGTRSVCCRGDGGHARIFRGACAAKADACQRGSPGQVAGQLPDPTSLRSRRSSYRFPQVPAPDHRGWQLLERQDWQRWDCYGSVVTEVTWPCPAFDRYRAGARWPACRWTSKCFPHGRIRNRLPGPPKVVLPFGGACHTSALLPSGTELCSSRVPGI